MVLVSPCIVWNLKIISFKHFKITEVSVKIRWNVYGKIVCQSPHKWEKLSAAKEKDKEALDIDPYVVAWTFKKKN